MKLLLIIGAIFLAAGIIGKVFKIRFNKRKWWHFGDNYRKSFSIEIAGFDYHPHFYFSVDGSERQVKVSFWFLFISFWFKWEGFFPHKFYPKEWNSHANGGNGGYLHSAERKIGVNFHDYAMWWCLWRDDDVWTGKDWRHNSWHPFRNFKGKHEVSYKQLGKENFLLPFLEGTYPIVVEKKQRIDKWKRWFTRRMITFEVTVGYENNEGEFVSLCVPHDGKGENSWDQGEDGTFSSYFSEHGRGEYGQNLRTCFDAALYFWQSCMRTRERRGSAHWRPSKFAGEKISFINKMPI